MKGIYARQVSWFVCWLGFCSNNKNFCAGYLLTIINCHEINKNSLILVVSGVEAFCKGFMP